MFVKFWFSVREMQNGSWHTQDWIEGIHGIWFHLFGVQFDAIQFAEMAIFKIGTFYSNWVASHFLYIKQG